MTAFAQDWKDDVVDSLLVLGASDITSITTDSNACLTEDQLQQLSDSVTVIRSSLVMMDNALNIAAIVSPQDADAINAVRQLIDQIDSKLETQLEHQLQPGYCATCNEIHQEIDIAVNDMLKILDIESSDWRNNPEYEAVEELIEIFRATIKMLCPGTEWPTTWPVALLVKDDCLTPTQRDSLDNAVSLIQSSLRIMDASLATAAIFFPSRRDTIMIIRDIIDEIDNKLISELQGLLVDGYCATCTQVSQFIDSTLTDMYATLDKYAPGWRDDPAFDSITQIITILTDSLKLICP
jgi:hypothetical protein